jgi:hypothetical protein
MPVVLGHARDLKALPGGQATHDTMDAPKIAVLRRGGLRPHASGYPAELRATRDLLRRRLPRLRTRAALLAHVQQTNRPSNLPELGPPLADKAHRAGMAERFPAPAVHTSIGVDLALIGPYDRRLTDLELDLVQPAQADEAHTCYRRRSIPGVGTILARGRLDESHARQRLPRGQACVASGRLVQCAQASAGTRDGTAGQKLGKASCTWACSDAVVWL